LVQGSLVADAATVVSRLRESMLARRVLQSERTLLLVRERDDDDVVASIAAV
jgi:hypothetical protein